MVGIGEKARLAQKPFRGFVEQRKQKQFPDEKMQGKRRRRAENVFVTPGELQALE